MTVVDGSGHVITRPRRLDDFRYEEQSDFTEHIFKGVADVNFYGVSVRI